MSTVAKYFCIQVAVAVPMPELICKPHVNTLHVYTRTLQVYY